MVHRPVRKNRAPINKLAGHRAEHARIIRADAVIAHNEVAVFRDSDRAKVAHVLVLRWDVRFIDGMAVHIDDALPDLDTFSGQSDDAFDERFRMVERIPENNNIAALNRFEPVDKLVDKNAFLVGEKRSHAGAFDFYRLVQKHDDDEGQANGNQKIACPNTDFISQGMG